MFDCLLRTVDPAARQTIERRIAQGRDQLASCADEGRRLGELDREIKSEQHAYKEATVSLSAPHAFSPLNYRGAPDRTN